MNIAVSLDSFRGNWPFHRMATAFAASGRAASGRAASGRAASGRAASGRFRGSKKLFAVSHTHTAAAGRARPDVPGAHLLTVHHVGTPANADRIFMDDGALAPRTPAAIVAVPAVRAVQAVHVISSQTAHVAADRLAVGSPWVGRLAGEPGQLAGSISTAGHSIGGRCTVGYESVYATERLALTRQKMMDLGLVAAWAAVVPALLWAGHAAGF